MKLICQRCSVEFESSRAKARYCSLHCANQKTKYTKCLGCGISRGELLLQKKIPQGFRSGLCQPCTSKKYNEKAKTHCYELTPKSRYHADSEFRRKSIENSKRRYRNNREEALAYQKEWVKRNPERYKALSDDWRLRRNEYHKAYQRRKSAEYREAVLNAYGRKCQCCGEARQEFLTIEHLFKNGKVHRVVMTGSIYKWLINNNFPKDGFALYCYNCNFYEKDGKVCPHKKERGITDLGILELHKCVLPQPTLFEHSTT